MNSAKPPRRPAANQDPGSFQPDPAASIVGAILNAGSEPLPPKLAKLVAHAPEAFDDQRHALVAVAVREVLCAGQPVNLESVYQALKVRGVDADVGGLPGLIALANDTLALGLAEIDAAEVWRAYQRRKVSTVFAEADTQIAANPGMLDTILHVTRQALGDLAGDSLATDIKKARAIGTLTAPEPGGKDDILLERYLCRGGGLLMVGQSGQGKSSLAMQFAVLWSLNRPCFGIRPARALRVLIVQAENDDGDLFEMFDGVCRGLGLTDAERLQAGESIFFHSETRMAGQELIANVIDPLCQELKLDLVILDNALSYVRGDTKDATVVGEFLRRGFNPVLAKHGCALLLLHHTTKAKADGPVTTHDLLYSGAGSIEWTNWARAVLSLETKGQGVYRLHAPKRGRRIGWRDANDQLIVEKFIRHSRLPGTICWYEIDDAEVEAGAKVGKTKLDLLAHVPSTGAVAQTILIEKAAASGIGQKKARAFLDELLEEGTLYVWLIKRSGTNAEKRLSRQPQTELELAPT